MKINGKAVPTRKRETLVFERNGEDVVFVLEGIRSFSKFEKLCPEPKPPVRTYRDGRKENDTSNKSYKTALALFTERKMSWLVIEALRNSPGLTWDTVDYDKPETWVLWEKELLDSGFNSFEIERIRNIVWRVNSLDDSSLEEARLRFLASQALEESKESFQVEEQDSTESGEPANDSVSDLPT